MNYVIVYQDDYLAHHGVKGMKWGVRRYQNADGSLTALGRQHYGYGEGERKQASATVSTKSSGGKSGLSKEEKARRARNIALAIGGTALAAAGTYVLIKHGKEWMDTTIKAGTTLQRVDLNEKTTDVRDAFFASFKKGDNKTYRDFGAMKAAQAKEVAKAYENPEVKKTLDDLKEQFTDPDELNQVLKAMGVGGNDERNILKLKANKDIRVASVRNSKKIFDSLYKKDSSFRKAVDQAVDENIMVELAGVGSGHDTKFDKFHRVVAGNLDSTYAKKYFDMLSEKGYGALIDKNDRAGSGRGLGTKAPVIIFNNNKSKSVTVDAIKKLDSSSANPLEIQKKLMFRKFGNEIVNGSDWLPTQLLWTTAGAGVAAGVNQKKMKQAQAVRRPA